MHKTLTQLATMLWLFHFIITRNIAGVLTVQVQRCGHMVETPGICKDAYNNQWRDVQSASPSLEEMKHYAVQLRTCKTNLGRTAAIRPRSLLSSSRAPGSANDTFQVTALTLRSRERRVHVALYNAIMRHREHKIKLIVTSTHTHLHVGSRARQTRFLVDHVVGDDGKRRLFVWLYMNLHISRSRCKN
jgi:hypothetical protein